MERKGGANQTSMRSNTVEHFVAEKNNFEDDSLINWEPVKLIAEDWSYVVMLLGKRYQASTHVLNSLKFVNIFL